MIYLYVSGPGLHIAHGAFFGMPEREDILLAFDVERIVGLSNEQLVALIDSELLKMRSKRRAA